MFSKFLTPPLPEALEKKFTTGSILEIFEEPL